MTTDPVDRKIRTKEAEIDRRLQCLPILQTDQAILVRAILSWYRQEMGSFHFRFGKAASGLGGGIAAPLVDEHAARLGAFEALKCAFEFAPSHGHDRPPSRSEISELIQIACDYLTFSDVLFAAKRHRARLEYDSDAETLAVYQDANLSGHDSEIIATSRVTTPLTPQTPLVEDSDRLTERWTAGDFRAVCLALSKRAQSMARVAQEYNMQSGLVIGMRPILVVPPKFTDIAHRAIVEDLTLCSKVVSEGRRWSSPIVDFMEAPIVQVGPKLMAPSDLLMTLGSQALDDYMIRVARRVDPAQYSRVSEERHRRLCEFVAKALRSNGWNADPNVILHPTGAHGENEVDVLGRRGDDLIAIECKTTYRPQSPAEVFGRNKEIIGGIDHTVAVLSRSDVESNGTRTGLVVTDGYRGDYECWAHALKTDISIAAIDDISVVAQDPQRAIGALRENIGIRDTATPSDGPSHTFKLFGLTVTVTEDAPCE